MNHVLLGLTLTCYVSAELNHAQLASKFIYSLNGNTVAKSKSNAIKPEIDNKMYFDKPDNMMRMPMPFEEVQTKKKQAKKHPKSTIQKIIARNRRNKKVMANRLTSKPTTAPESDDLIEEFVSDRDDDPTTQTAMKKKIKKWNSKLTKYQGQVQKMQNRIVSKNRRTKRDTDRENTIILQDFDEFEFVDRKKDYDVVKTHYKRYWK